MPKALEKKLKKQAKKKFGSTTSERARKYIYGTLQKVTDWKPTGGRKKTRVTKRKNKKSKNRWLNGTNRENRKLWTKINK